MSAGTCRGGQAPAARPRRARGRRSRRARARLVALAQQHAERAITLASIARRRGEAPAQQRRGRARSRLIVRARARCSAASIRSRSTPRASRACLDPARCPTARARACPGRTGARSGRRRGALLDQRLRSPRSTSRDRCPCRSRWRAHLRPRALAAVQVAVRERERLAATGSAAPDGSSRLDQRQAACYAARLRLPRPPSPTAWSAGSSRGSIALTEVAVDAQGGVDLGLDLLGHVRVLVEERLGVAASLTEPLLAVGEERARLGDDVVLDAVVEQAARGRDPLAELDVELGLLERRRDLVLDDLDPNPVADRLGAVLDRLDPADVQPLGGIELQRPTARLASPGEPNITPTFSRIWFVNTHSVWVRLRPPVSLRIACDIIRACTPTVWSPI